MGTKTRMVLLVVGTILVLDQVTKLLVERSMVPYQSEPVIASFFHLTYVRNTGAAFGLLAQAPDWFRQPFFFIATAVAIVALGLFLRHTAETDRLTILAVAAILGGAVGNLIDRLRYGYVIDFLDFHWRGYHWPAFNVADSCITLGVLGLLWSAVWIKGAELQRD
jgi:signal peptidase II